MFCAMPLARAASGSLHSVFAAQRTKPFVSLSHFFILLNYNLSDAFQVCFILFGRPFGSGFYGFRCATEHPADGSPSGPANPSRNCFKLKSFFVRYLSGPCYSGLVTLGFCYAKNQALRIPIAFFYFVEL